MEKRSENGNYEGNTKTKVFLTFPKTFYNKRCLNWAQFGKYSLEEFSLGK